MASRDESLQLTQECRTIFLMLWCQPTIILMHMMHGLCWKRSVASRHHLQSTFPGPSMSNIRRVARCRQWSIKCALGRQGYLNRTNGRCRQIASKVRLLQQHPRQKYTYSTSSSSMHLSSIGAKNNRWTGIHFGSMLAISSIQCIMRRPTCHRPFTQAIRLYAK